MIIRVINTLEIFEVKVGFYCCCDAKLSAGEPCICDWNGWTKINSADDQPKVNGKYLVRICDNSADKKEDEMEFSVIPFRFEQPMYGGPCPIHWKDTHWDDDIVYAWKELSTHHKYLRGK